MNNYSLRTKIQSKAIAECCLRAQFSCHTDLGAFLGATKPPNWLANSGVSWVKMPPNTKRMERLKKEADYSRLLGGTFNNR